MPRIAGRNGRLYAGIGPAGTPEPIAFVAKWAVNFSSDKYDVTAMGDSGKVYVAGLPDAQGTYNGFWDDATPQLYTAATDGVARKFYLYPNTGNTGRYWFGSAIFDFSVDGDVAGPVSIQGSFAAATPVISVG